MQDDFCYREVDYQKSYHMENTLIWGIDLGGTKIEGAVLDADKRVLARLRLPTESHLGYDHIINQIAQVIALLKKETGANPKRLGMGTPGTIDPPTQLLKNSNTLVLNGRPFRRDVSEALGIQVVTANDANCFTVAEARMGIVQEVAPHAKVVFGVIMGTGVGGGIVINGEVLEGGQGIAGEWGHSFLDESGGPCYCGNTGCVETIISGPALERYYESLTAQHLRMPQILECHHQQSDPAATQTFQRLIHFFGKGLANIINILDPDVIVLGGGVGNTPQLYTEGVDAIRQFVFNTRLDTIIAAPRLGDSAGVFGAALLVE